MLSYIIHLFMILFLYILFTKTLIQFSLPTASLAFPCSIHLSPLTSLHSFLLSHPYRKFILYLPFRNLYPFLPVSKFSKKNSMISFFVPHCVTFLCLSTYPTIVKMVPSPNASSYTLSWYLFLLMRQNCLVDPIYPIFRIGSIKI